MIRGESHPRGGGPAAGAAVADSPSALGPDLAAEFARRKTVRRYKAGQALFHEKQQDDRVLMLRTGRVKVIATTSNGREVVLAFRGPGELIGEQAAIDGIPRSATVCAVEPVEVLSMTARDFIVFLKAHPDTSVSMLRMLSLRLRDADAKRIEFSAFTTIERVAARLLELAERFGAEQGGSIRIQLPLTQEELAGATGSSIESVGRALQTMRSLKCIETRRRDIRILDREALDALRHAAG